MESAGQGGSRLRNGRNEDQVAGPSRQQRPSSATSPLNKKVKLNVSLGDVESVIRPCQVPLVRCDPQVPKRRRHLLQRQISGSDVDATFEGSGGGGRRRQRYHCSQCSKSYSTKSGLIEHKKLHRDKNHFRCSTCGKRHAGHTALLYHRNTVHLGLKPFKCSRCGKAFAKRTKLFIHMTSHTGEKAFRCSACGNRFQYLQQLKEHVGMVDLCKDGAEAYRRKKYAEPRFPCPTCGRSFSLEEDLANHVGYHRDRSVERALVKKRRQR